jgi:Domain of unknown function (DUF5666)
VPAQDAADDGGISRPGWPGPDDWSDDDDWPGDVVWPAETDQSIPWAGEEDVPWQAAQDVPWADPHGVPPPGAGASPAGTQDVRAGAQDVLPEGEPGHSPRRGSDGWFGRVGWLAAVAVVAAVAGAGLTVGLTRAPASPSAGASSPSTPSPGSGGGSTAPGGYGGNGAAPVPIGGNEVSHIEMIGTVTAVSATSITIGGQGLSVTAIVTSATKITGQVDSIQQIKVGDQVSAEMTQSGSKVTALAIQYPAPQAAPGPP